MLSTFESKPEAPEKSDQQEITPPPSLSTHTMTSNKTIAWCLLCELSKSTFASSRTDPRRLATIADLAKQLSPAIFQQAFDTLQLLGSDKQNRNRHPLPIDAIIEEALCTPLAILCPATTSAFPTSSTASTATTGKYYKSFLHFYIFLHFCESYFILFV